MFLFFILANQYRPSGAYCPHEEATNHLRQGMLTKNHSAGAQCARHDEYDAEPPDRVEAKYLREREERACHTTNGGSMRADFPPRIDYGANYLHDNGGYQNASHKMGNVHKLHQVDAPEIAGNGYHVWYHASLLLPQLYRCPSLITAIEVDEECGHQDSEKIDDAQHRELVEPRQQTQVAEYEQQH